MYCLKKVIYLFVFALFFVPQSSFAAEPFEAWLLDFKQEALEKGISRQTIDAAFVGVKPIPKVIRLDRKQPEGSMTFAQYKKRVINQNRIDKGRALLGKHRSELGRVSARYGVQPQYIVALWGVETSYGSNTGGFHVVPALATLAHDGRRSNFFRKELINALKIIDGGHIKAAEMKGSWAGAMGQNQFMPSSFHAYAVDHNGDGRRDIWGSTSDIFASTANYLSKNGWKGDEKWGRKVKLTQNLPQSVTGMGNKKSLTAWKGMGVTLLNGNPIPTAPGIKAALVRPDGASGEAFLIYDNYRTIMTWNKSVYFATSVGLLADLIAQ